VLINAFRGGELDEAGLEPALTGMERLNDVASRLALEHGVTGCTDITGYGLAGHALEIARASHVALTIDIAALPVYDGMREMCALGITTRGARENESATADQVTLLREMNTFERLLLSDPQTSGGLLLCVPATNTAALLAALAAAGHRAARIGTVDAGAPALAAR
jgi:selenide,water dikinase